MTAPASTEEKGQNFTHNHNNSKMVPITGRASSFLEFFFFCMYVNRKEEEEGETEQLQSYQFT